MKNDIDLLAILTVGGRQNPEPSRALPQHYYGDPARFVKFVSERNCGRCFYSRTENSKQFCGKGKIYGVRCDFFKPGKGKHGQ